MNHTIEQAKCAPPVWRRPEMRHAISKVRNRFLGMRDREVWPDTAIAALLLKSNRVLSESQGGAPLRKVRLSFGARPAKLPPNARRTPAKVDNSVKTRVGGIYGSVDGLAKHVGAAGLGIARLLKEGSNPTDLDGEWTQSASDLAALLGADPEDIFPEAANVPRAVKEKAFVKLSAEQSCVDPQNDILRRVGAEDIVRKVFARLSERDERSLRMVLMEGMSLEELAQSLSTSRERARQVISKARDNFRSAARRLGYQIENVRLLWEV